MVLPELGGHLYTCIDKSNGAEMFYANRSIRKAQIGYRGAWAAYGIEFNFPVSHNWVSMSPVDFATTQNPDGSASIWVANVDRVYGMQWRVELRLAPRQRASRAARRPLQPERRCATASTGGTTPPCACTTTAASTIRCASRPPTASREVDTWPVNARGATSPSWATTSTAPCRCSATAAARPSWASTIPGRRPGSSTTRRPRTRPRRRSGPSAATPTASTGGGRSPTTRAPTSRSRPASSATRRPTASWSRRSRSASPSTGCPCGASAGSPAPTPRRSCSVERKAGKAGTVDLSFGVNVNRTVRGGRLRLKDGARVVHEEPLDLTPAQSLVRVRAGLAGGAALHLEVVGRRRAACSWPTPKTQWDYAAGVGDPAGPQPSAKVAAARRAHRRRLRRAWATPRSANGQSAGRLGRPTARASSDSRRASAC